ncbi:MAG TPA: diguanylate cyclase [Bryobacteraceae bacterium]|nr:diguanylate cyclase [Bryobacteraceae bacterium]
MEKQAPAVLGATRSAVIRILHLEDFFDDSELCRRELAKSEFLASIDVVQTAEEFYRSISSSTYDVILADYQLRDWNGMQALEVCRKLGSKIPFILVTGAIGEEKVARCMREGVSDFVFKNHLTRLPMVIQRCLEEQKLREEHERSAETLRESEQRFRALAESVASGILIYQGVDCKYANRKAEEITGYTREELALVSSWEIIHPDSRDLLIEACLARIQSNQPSQRFELKILTKDGTARWVDLTLGRIEVSGAPGGLFTINDITGRKMAEEELLFMAGNDPLTGLANGRYLVDSFHAETKRYARTARTFSLLIFDLDGLKQINDSFGHLVGSRALCRVANVLRSQCRNIDVIARPGGDEFTVILPETMMDGAQIFGRRICQRLADDHQHPQLTVSFGAAVYPGAGTFEDLFSTADKALYAMKARHHRCRVLEPQQYASA